MGEAYEHFRVAPLNLQYRVQHPASRDFSRGESLSGGQGYLLYRLTLTRTEPLLWLDSLRILVQCSAERVTWNCRDFCTELERCAGCGMNTLSSLHEENDVVRHGVVLYNSTPTGL